MKICLTGAYGFIGAHLARHLQNDGHELVTIKRDHAVGGTAERIGLNISTVYGNLCDLNTVLRTINDYDVDLIISVAADAIVKKAIDQPALVLSNNLNSTLSIMEAARLKDVKKVLYFSSDKCAGDKAFATENDSMVSEPYATSKLISEQIVETYSKTYGIKTLTTRSANVIGFGDTNKRICPNTIKDAINGKPPKIFNGLTTKREYIHVDDVYSAMNHLLKNEQTGLFNIGTGEVRNQEQVVLEILKQFPKIKPIYSDPPEHTSKELGDQQLNIDKIHKSGWTHKLSFDNAIKRIVNEEKKYNIKE